MQQAKKKQNFPLVEVTWQDSSSDSGWKREVNSELLTCWSAGYLVHKDNRSVVVALNTASTGSANSHGDTMVIPRRCVQKIRRLR